MTDSIDAQLNVQPEVSLDFESGDLSSAAPGSEPSELEKIQQQFNYGPYPRVPLDRSPRENYEALFAHSMVTAYYLRHRKVVHTEGKVILDAGCGSGYRVLMLAAANPGAKIIGIDFSEESIKMARQRLDYHGYSNTEFHVLRIEDLPQLGIQFDYINCDEVLYLLPNPSEGLRAMKSVLKPDGLIRTNLHNAYQRQDFFRAQELFKFIGLMDDSPKEFEEEAVIETMKSLKGHVKLKTETWSDQWFENKPAEQVKEYLAMNFLFVGDRGYTIPEMFEFLEQADLEFVSMVNWRHWEITDLFQDDALPAFWEMGLATASIADRLHIYELLNPIHRLIDFWCTHPGEPGQPVDDWSDIEWQNAIVHLHPQLRTEVMKEDLLKAIQTGQAFEISSRVKAPAYQPVFLEPSQAACFLPLWEGPQPIQVIAERYRQVRPVDPITLEPLSAEQAFAIVKDLLNRMDAFLYVLLEQA